MKTYYVAGIPYSDELYHYQVRGAKHGVRRYQNYDGSYTPLGRIHYGIGQKRYTNPDGTLNEAGKKRYLDYDKGQKNYEKIMNAASKTSAKIDYFDFGDPLNKIRKRVGKRMDDFERRIPYYDLDIKDKMTNYYSAVDKWSDALEKRKRNINPFKAKKLYNDLSDANKRLEKEAKDYMTIMANVTVEDINRTFPKKDRDAIMTLVAIKYFDYDW